jgi:hypothetical protein
MVMPTRIIETAEFNKLMDMEGNTLPVFRLDAVKFDPPRPDGKVEPPYPVGSVNILLMNVAEPVIYKDGDGTAFIILNGYDEENVMTYESFRDAHVVKDAWYYRLAPHYYDPFDKDYSMDECRYVFAPDEEI